MELLTDDVKEKLIELMEDGLQFVDKAQDISCNNCGRIPLFHFIYPCSHPYCRDCYVNVCVRLKKKCRVCKTEIGTKMLQSKQLEAAVYKLKAICPNKPFGCDEEIELNTLLNHLEECSKIHNKEKQLPKLYNRDRDTSYEGIAGYQHFKETISNMKITISDLVVKVKNSTKRDKQLYEDNRRLIEENTQLMVKVEKIFGDVNLLKGSNERMDREIEQNKNDSVEQTSAVGKDLELLNQKLQLLSDTVTAIGPNIKEKFSADLGKLNAAFEIVKTANDQNADKIKEDLLKDFQQRLNRNTLLHQEQQAKFEKGFKENIKENLSKIFEKRLTETAVDFTSKSNKMSKKIRNYFLLLFLLLTGFTEVRIRLAVRGDSELSHLISQSAVDRNAEWDNLFDGKLSFLNERIGQLEIAVVTNDAWTKKNIDEKTVSYNERFQHFENSLVLIEENYSAVTHEKLSSYSTMISDLEKATFLNNHVTAAVKIKQEQIHSNMMKINSTVTALQNRAYKNMSKNFESKLQAAIKYLEDEIGQSFRNVVFVIVGLFATICCGVIRFRMKMKDLTNILHTQVVNAARRIETIQEDGNQNTEKIKAVDNNVSILETLMDKSVNDLTNILHTQLIANLSKDFEIKLVTKTTEIYEKFDEVLKQLQKQSIDNAEMLKRIEDNTEKFEKGLKIQAQRLEDFVKKVTQLEKNTIELTNLEDSCKTLSENMTSCQKRVDALENDLSSSKEQLRKSIDENNSFSKKEFDGKLSSYNTKLDELNTSIGQSKEDTDEKMSTCNTLIGQLQTKIQLQEDIMKTIEEQMSSCNTKFGELNTKINAINQIEANIVTSNTVIGQLSTKIQLQEDKNKAFNEKMSSCNTEIEELNTKINTTNQQTINQIEAEIVICNNKIGQLERKDLNINAKFNEMESTINTIKNQDIVQIRKSQKDSMDVIAAMKGQKNGVFIWEINEFSKKKKMASTSADGFIDYYSDEFYSSEYGYKMKLKVKFQKDQLAVFLGFVPGEHDAHLPAVFYHRRTYFIFDQSDRKEKRHVVGVREPCFRDGKPERWMKVNYGNPNFCTYSLLETKYKDVYLKDDRIFLKVVVEPIFPLTRSPFSNDGILMWKVLNYARTKQESQDKICFFFYSDFFYSSTHGYRMKCYLIFSENQLNIWLFFLEGKFDDLLPDVYAHKVTFSILDQNDNSGNNNINYVATLDPKVIGDEKAKERISATGCSGAGFLFANFEKTPFLVNDSILIKVDVKPI